MKIVKPEKSAHYNYFIIIIINFTSYACDLAKIRQTGPSSLALVLYIRGIVSLWQTWQQFLDNSNDDDDDDDGDGDADDVSDGGNNSAGGQWW